MKKCKNSITFFSNFASPCARRIDIMLNVKNASNHAKINYEKVEINLLKGEQRSAEYLAINPLGTVPCIRLDNIDNMSSGCLYESAAIAEFLDEAFPKSKPLYPDDIYQKTQVRMWQYWELMLAEEYWPLGQQQVVGVLARAKERRVDFLQRICSLSDNAFFIEKQRRVYDAELLTLAQAKRSMLCIFRGLKMLDNELANKQDYLVGDALTMADISIYPRIMKTPQNGLLVTKKQRALLPHLEAYLDKLSKQPGYNEAKIMDFVFWKTPLFSFLLSGLLRIGNWRCKKTFKRVVFKDIEPQLAKDNAIMNRDVRVIPTVPKDIVAPVFYYASENPLAMSVCLISHLLDYKCQMMEIDSINFEHLMPQYLQINPMGDVPTLVTPEMVIYGPNVVAEFMNSVSSKHLTPTDAVNRAKVRRWFGWARTLYCHHLQPLYLASTGFEDAVHSKYHTVEAYQQTVQQLVCPCLHDSKHFIRVLNHQEKPSTQPHVEELMLAINYVSNEFIRNNTQYLVTNEVTMADLFVLPIVLLAEVYGVKLTADLCQWKNTLFEQPLVEKIMAQMLSQHTGSD